jgi:hypothetical protein
LDLSALGVGFRGVGGNVHMLLRERVICLLAHELQIQGVSDLICLMCWFENR